MKKKIKHRVVYEIEYTRNNKCTDEELDSFELFEEEEIF